MKVRIEKTKDFYPTILSWWAKHSFIGPHQILLPVNVFIVSSGDQDLYFCFFYNTDSALAYVAYPSSNKDAPVEIRKDALEYLFAEMEKYAKEQGYLAMYTTSATIPVIDALTKEGYKEADLKVNQYFKFL